MHDSTTKQANEEAIRQVVMAAGARTRSALDSEPTTTITAGDLKRIGRCGSEREVA